MTEWEHFWNEYRSAKNAQHLKHVLGHLGVHVTGDKVLCPAHNDSSPSLHVYQNHGHCFVCGFNGDLADFLVAKGDSRDVALRTAARAYGISDPPDARIEGGGAGSETTARQTPSLNAEPVSANRDYADKRAEGATAHSTPAWLPDVVAQAVAAYEAAATPEAQRVRDYVRGRQLHTVASSLRFGVIDSTVTSRQAGNALNGLRGRLLLTTFLDNENPTAVNGRAPDDTAAKHEKYWKPFGLTAQAPFGAHTLRNAVAAGRVIVTEGELDAASIHAVLGLHEAVLGLSGGTLPKTKTSNEWPQQLAALGVPIYVVADSDQPGEQKAQALRAKLHEAGAKAHVVRLRGYDDVNALLCAVGPVDAKTVLENALRDAVAAETADVLYVQDGFLAELDRRLNRQNAQYTTGLDELDKLLDGGYAEGLHLLGGLTGTGKTSFALHLAVQNALEGRSVLLSTFEQSRYELWARITASLTGVPYPAIKRGYFAKAGEDVPTSTLLQENERWPYVVKVARHLRVVEGVGDALSGDDGTRTLEVLQADAEAIRDAHGTPPLIVVDYVQRMPAPSTVKDVQERVSYNAGRLQVHLARTVGSPVLALSSVNRKSYNLASLDIEDRLAAFKAAGELEYTSYTSLLLYGLPEAKQGLQMKPGMLASWKPMVLELVKNREGRTGRVACRWTPQRDTWEHAMLYGSETEAL